MRRTYTQYTCYPIFSFGAWNSHLIGLLEAQRWSKPPIHFNFEYSTELLLDQCSGSQCPQAVFVLACNTRCAQVHNWGHSHKNPSIFFLWVRRHMHQNTLLPPPANLNGDFPSIAHKEDFNLRSRVKHQWRGYYRKMPMGGTLGYSPTAVWHGRQDRLT